VLYKDKVIFEQYKLKKQARFGIKIISCVIVRYTALCAICLCIWAKTGNECLPQ